MGAFRFGPGAADRRRSLSATADVHTALSDEVVRLVAAGGDRGVVVASLTGDGTYAGRPIAPGTRRLLTDYGYGRIDGAALGRGLSAVELASAPIVRDDDDFVTRFLADLTYDGPEAVAATDGGTARVAGAAPGDFADAFLSDLVCGGPETVLSMDAASTPARATRPAPWDFASDFVEGLLDDPEPEGEDGAMSMMWDLGDGPDAEESD